MAHSPAIYAPLTQLADSGAVQLAPPDNDQVLCECDLPPLQRLVESLEPRHTIAVTKAPVPCLTLLRAEDSLEKQEFYLGEALTTECDVLVDGATGYGLCLGEEPVRAYCLAVCDAFLHGGLETPAEVTRFLDEQRALLVERETEEFNHILRTQVDFKLMEQD